MKKRNSLYPIVHIPMFQIGGGKGAPEYVDPSKFKPMIEPKKINPDEMRFSDWYKAQLKAGKAGDVVTYRGKKILLDPRDFPGYKAPSGQTKPSGGTQPSSNIDPKYNKTTDEGDRYYEYKTKDGYNARRFDDGTVDIFLPDRTDVYFPDGTINKRYNNNRTVRINPNGTTEIGNRGDGKSFVPLKSPTPPSRSNTPVKAPTAATKEQNTQRVNGPLTAITEGIDWLNERTGDNPLGAATRFVLNAAKAPFEGGKNLAANTQTLVNEGKNEFGAHSALDAVNAFAPAVGKGIGYVAKNAPRVVASFRGLGKPQMVPRSRAIERQMLSELEDPITLQSIKNKQGYLQRMNNIGREEAAYATKTLDDRAARALKEAADEEAVYLNHIKNKQGYYQGMNNEAAREAQIIEDIVLPKMPKRVQQIAKRQKKAGLYQDGGMFIPMFDESDYMDEDYLYNDFDSEGYMEHGGIHINPANKGKFKASANRARNASKWKHQAGGYIFKQIKS